MTRNTPPHILEIMFFYNDFYLKNAEGYKSVYNGDFHVVMICDFLENAEL